MALDYVALKNEIITDPMNIGFAPLVANGQDADIANKLNSKTGPGVGTATLTVMDRDSFLHALLPATIALAGATAAIQAKWDRLLGVVKSVTTVPMTTDIVNVLNSLVTDGLMTQAAVNAINQVPNSSRAEVLFGIGTVITDRNVAFAFGRGQG